MRNLIPIIFKILSYLPSPPVCTQHHVAARLIALRCIDTPVIPLRLWHHMLGCVSLTQMSSSAVSGSNNPTSGHRWCCCPAWSSSHSVPPPAQAFPMCTQGRHPPSSQVLTSCTNTSTCITSSPHWASDTSVQFSRSVVWPHELKQARPPYPSPAPGVYSNSCPSSQWYHPIILFSVIPFSSCLQSFPAAGSFQMSQFFASGGQSIEVSASTSVLPMNIQGLFTLGWTDWISLQSKGLSRVFSNTTVRKHHLFSAQLSL